MTRRDEMLIQMQLLAGNSTILVSKPMYRALRHHPHFRFFMHRFRKLDSMRTMRRTRIKVSLNEFPMYDEGWQLDPPLPDFVSRRAPQNFLVGPDKEDWLYKLWKGGKSEAHQSLADLSAFGESVTQVSTDGMATRVPLERFRRFTGGGFVYNEDGELVGPTPDESVCFPNTALDPRKSAT